MTNLHAKALDDLVFASRAALHDLLQQLPPDTLVYDHIPDITKKKAKPVKLYKVDSEIAAALNQLQAVHDAQLNLQDKSEKKHSWHNKVCNFINPQASTNNYSVHIVHKFKHVNAQDKVHEYLPGEIARAINVERKKLRESNNPDTQRLKADRLTLEAKIEHAEQKVDDMLTNPEKYEVRISAKVRAYNYAEVRINGKNKHLSDQKPNCVWYLPEMRSNDHHTRFMQKATHLIGDIYYIEHDVEHDEVDDE